MGIYLLYIIPVVLIHSVHGQVLRFNIDENPLTKAVGQFVSVVCMLSMDSSTTDEVEYKWSDNKGEPITSTAISEFPYIVNNFRDASGDTGLLLIIGDATKSTAGNYKCVATLKDNVYEKTLEILIKDVLEFVNCDSEQFGMLGEDSVVKCTAVSGSQLFSTFWGKTEKNVDIQDANLFLHTATTLTILTTKLEDAGTYIYTAIAGTDAGMRNIKFDVYTSPKIEIPMGQTTAVVGKEATLYCKAIGRPDPILEWTKAGSTNILTTGDRLTVTETKEGDYVQGILTIASVIKEDESSYTCTAKNLATEKNRALPSETTAKLIVQIPPKIEPMVNSKGTEGGPASLVCVVRGYPIPNIIWENVKTQERYSSASNIRGISVQPKNLDDPGNVGAQLTLSFTKLTHSDAGDYRCVAKNKADTAEAIVMLEVLYRPNFLDQGPTNFFNWAGYSQSFIPCVANANTPPAFKWYRDSREITGNDDFYRIGPTVINPEKPHQATSKLHVIFNGNNAIFGDYVCAAFNPTGENNISLSMVKAEHPAMPVVTVQEEDARHILFWLYKPLVIGPDITHFKVVYKVQGSGDEAMEQLVAINDRHIEDVARTYTVLSVMDLLPDTKYIFTFYTINPVGQSNGKELMRTTHKKRAPNDPVIKSEINSPYSDKIQVDWDEPSDGGEIILEYRLTYQHITVKGNSSSDGSRGYELSTKVTSVVVVDSIQDSSYLIKKLLPGIFYQVKVYARNSIGYSVPGVQIFRTKEDPSIRPNTSGAPKMVPVSVSVTVFGCLAALSACLKCFV